MESLSVPKFIVAYSCPNKEPKCNSRGSQEDSGVEGGLVVFEFKTIIEVSEEST